MNAAPSLIDTPASRTPVHGLATPILVVDDVEQNLIAMRALLERPGVQVLCASSADAALELLLQHDVALALLDVHMPGTDGLALAELMRGTERTRHVPIIFLTATSQDANRSFRGYEAGAVDYLTKPVDERVICSKVEVFVELYQQRRVLAARNAELQHALKLNETMTAVLTHDLRTPLSAITLSAEVLRRTAPDDRTAAAAGRIDSSARRMARMIEQLLDFSLIRTGVLQLRPQAAQLDLLCQQVVAELRQAKPAMQIEVAHHGPLDGRFDPDRIMQVLANLMGNALQHGAPGEPVRVVLDGRDPTHLQVQVRNTGALPETVQAHLFTPFRSGGNGESSGLGLGLYIVDQFIQAHGGRVSGRSEGDETVFAFSWPRRLA